MTTTSAAEAPSTTVVVDPVQQSTTTVVTPVTLPFTGGGSGQTVALVAAGLLLAGIGLVIASRRGEDPSSKAWASRSTN
ncbi:MAG TPA: LPXTG cell wall anchor domain-containing protein [Acidimicrobiia bacterium]|nr:LPXTG cell wall anchor domain-containing protein [Acidimicrobiia bacterium]